ncbi:ankyrin repeat domain-containing protein 31 [Ochotona princeps]|uniref:ankyrin repeat domain-containing protein 31 n=1 Tax=Ochotona princeps TaxID=9978 RepID=UPI00271460F9|nr:ankyrin repeat domain-containing protein 31 [Ochotona princeps]
MEECAQALEWDSDETVVGGSMTESEPEEEELPWRRLLCGEDTSRRGLLSPEIPLGFKHCKGPQTQVDESVLMPVPGAGTPSQVWSVLTKYGYYQLQVLSWTPQELSEERDFPERSFFSSAATVVPGTERESVVELEVSATSDTLAELGNEVALTVAGEEICDEESSLETFVSALERQITSPGNACEERLSDMKNSSDPGMLKSLLSPVLTPLVAMVVCGGDFVPDTGELVSPAEPPLTLSPFSGAGMGPVCPSARNEALEMEPEADCTQIAGMASKQGSELADLQDRRLSAEETLEDPDPIGLQRFAHQNVTSCELLSDKGTPASVENSCEQGSARVLRRSCRVGRLKGSMSAQPSDDVLPKVLGVEDLTGQCSAGTLSYFPRKQAALGVKGQQKETPALRSKSTQIRKRGQHRVEKGRRKKYDVTLSSINRRNVFGENLLYQAVLHNDVDLVHHFIKKGANVNQPSYAGWTALHEASMGGFYKMAYELLKGGADVNIRGAYQITPLQDAVINGHYKVAELLLMNGANPLLMSNNGKSALDEASDVHMKQLLERYISRRKRYLMSAIRSDSDPVAVEDICQCKRPKFSCRSCENFNGQKSEYTEVNKRSKEDLHVNENYVYANDHKWFGKPKYRQSACSQVDCGGLRESTVSNVRDSSTDTFKGKGREDSQHEGTQAGARDCHSRKALAVSQSSGVQALVIHQQHGLHGHEDPDSPEDPNSHVGPFCLPEELPEPSISAASRLKTGIGNNMEADSFSKETHTQNLDLPNSQETQLLDLRPIDQTAAVSFSALVLDREIELPFVDTDPQPPAHQKQHSSPSQTQGKENSGHRNESLNRWENSFLSFIKGTSDVGAGAGGAGRDSCTSEKTVTAENICSTDGKSQYTCKTTINEEELDFRPLLLSADNFSQGNELSTDNLITLPTQEAANFSDSDITVISGQYIANHRISLDHSYSNPEQESMPCVRTDDVSEVVSHVEPFREPPNHSQGTPELLTSQAVTLVEKVENNQGAQRNHTDSGQNVGSSSGPFSAVISFQGIGTTEVERPRPGLLENEAICGTDFHSNDDVNEELTHVPQLRPREQKENFHTPGGELTNNGDESVIKNCKKKKEKASSETHMPTNGQERRKLQNSRTRQKFLKITCKQEKKASVISKRNARGESRLHAAAKRGNVSLVKALIDSGADVNLQDYAGWTPLHEASNTGSSDVITELLNAGAHVNCGNMDGILPLHDAVANNHLKAAEILLQHGADPNQKHQQQKTALDEAHDERMRGLLKAYGAVESESRNDSNAASTAKTPRVRSRKSKGFFCDDHTVDPPCPANQGESRENLPLQQTVSAILQDIREKQAMLLEFEIRNRDDAEQYIEKMLEIKEVMDNVLAKQKAERDDLAKKYRVSIESFKQGVLREQLTNLATRQKDLLAVARKQKEISLKIQNCKNSALLPGFGVRKPTSEISSEGDLQQVTSLENSVWPQSAAPCPDTLETWSGSQNTSLCAEVEVRSRENVFENKATAEQDSSDRVLDGLVKSRYPNSPEKTKPSSQPTAAAGVKSSYREDNFTETSADGRGCCRPSAEPTDVRPLTATSGEDLSVDSLQQRNRKVASQQHPRVVPKCPTQQGAVLSGSHAVHPAGPSGKPALATQHSNDSCSHASSSGAGQQEVIRKPFHHSTIPKKKCMQIKDLMSLGRIHPGVNILEFKTQETTHKASILVNGKIKVESGQIYQNPVSWIKDLVGGDSYVTWNYAWSKVTYLGKQLLKYASEEVPSPPSPCHPHLPGGHAHISQALTESEMDSTNGTSRESTQSIPCYLQINEILLISDQEFLPCNVMNQHWKFYAECEELTF